MDYVGERRWVRGETRWDRKHREILEAAATLFLTDGYVGTSMDEVAAAASVSKQTVYKHFSDKEHLFTEIVLATTDHVHGVVRRVVASLGDSYDLKRDLPELARRFLAAIMDPEFLRLRRLVIANAHRFPEVGASWYEESFVRGPAAFAERFRQLMDRGLLRADDPLLAAHHFIGLLLWVPINRAMFTGREDLSAAELDQHAGEAVRLFLAAYAVSPEGS
jgi:TetR/AcrR family transcriptional repressor of mexJK operon